MFLPVNGVLSSTAAGIKKRKQEKQSKGKDEKRRCEENLFSWKFYTLNTLILTYK